jgi:Flp pilus assembly protein TadD
MVHEKLDDIAGLERDLRRVISLKPDHAHAYNALGYTLADRNVRLEEALPLIEKAATLAPRDGFILDSLGWAYFRLGNLDKAVALLREAFTLRNDPEIAAHLGEALWKAGQREEAMQLLEASQRQHPGNEALESTARRLRGQP